MSTTPTIWSSATLVNPGGGGTNYSQSLALPSGGYLVAWQDLKGHTITAQFYDSLGHKVGAAHSSISSHPVSLEFSISLFPNKIGITYLATDEVMYLDNYDLNLKLTSSPNLSIADASLKTHSLVILPNGDYVLGYEYQGGIRELFVNSGVGHDVIVSGTDDIALTVLSNGNTRGRFSQHFRRQE
jgi:hypothetical protein